jgi:flagellar hook-length control protein FliK
MSRVDTPPTALPRTRTLAQSRIARAGAQSPAFALPELGSRSAPNGPTRPAGAASRPGAAEAARRDSRAETPAREVDRREDGADRPAQAPTERRPADRNRPTGSKTAAERDRDAPAAAEGEEAERVGAEEAEANGTALQPDPVLAGAVALAPPDGAAPAASGQDGGGEQGPAKSSGAVQAGARSPKAPAGAVPNAPAGAAAEADAAAPEGAAKAPAVPVLAGGPAETLAAAGERGRAAEAGPSELLNPAKDAGPEPVLVPAKPVFADLLDPVKGAETRAGAAVQRTVSDVPIGRVPIEIGLKALDGTNSFEIRLSPDELGRVDVKLDIDQSGEVRAHLIVERPEALALLTRDRAQLERAFEQAGLRPAQDGIAMSLRDGGGGGGFAGHGGHNGDPQPQAGARSRAAEDVARARGSIAPVLPRAILSRLGALDLTI